MGNCIYGSASVYAAPRDKWRILLDANAALDKYIADHTLLPFCTDDELEFRALLDENFACAHFMDYAAPCEASVLKCWNEMNRYKGIENIVPYEKQLLKMIQKSPVLSVFTTDLNQAFNSPEQKVDKYDDIRKDIMRCCVIHLYENLYLSYKETDDYVQLCDSLRDNMNKVTINDFAYFCTLGEGGFGVVLQCAKKSTGVNYAMKIQSKSHLYAHHRRNPRNVAIEMLAMAECKHPYLSNVAYAFQTPSFVITATNLSELGSLKRTLMYSAFNGLSLNRVQFYAAEITSALCYLVRLWVVISSIVYVQYRLLIVYLQYMCVHYSINMTCFIVI